MSEYRKKANTRDNIMMIIVVLAILGGAIFLIVEQFSEVDLSKKELEDIRAKIKLEEVALLNKQDEWNKKVEDDEENLYLKQEELNIELQNIEALKAKFSAQLEEEKAKFSEGSRKDLENTLRAEFDLKISQHEKYQNQLKNQVKKLESKNKSLTESNSKLEQDIAKYKKFKTEAEKLSRQSKLAALKAKANDSVLVLMNKFSALDVDLKKPDWCDKEYTKRYNQADRLLEAIKAQIKKYDLSDSYKAFASANSKSSNNTSSEGWCNGVKVQ